MCCITVKGRLVGSCRYDLASIYAKEGIVSVLTCVNVFGNVLLLLVYSDPSILG